MRKFKKSQHYKNFSIRKSYDIEKIEIKNDEIDMNIADVIYIKFIDGSFLDIEEMKKILKKYGEIQKIFRKIEGRSYFIEFKDKVT